MHVFILSCLCVCFVRPMNYVWSLEKIYIVVGLFKGWFKVQVKVVN